MNHSQFVSNNDSTQNIYNKCTALPYMKVLGQRQVYVGRQGQVSCRQGMCGQGRYQVEICICCQVGQVQLGDQVGVGVCQVRQVWVQVAICNSENVQIANTYLTVGKLICQGREVGLLWQGSQYVRVGKLVCCGREVSMLGLGNQHEGL